MKLVAGLKALKVLRDRIAVLEDRITKNFLVEYKAKKAYTNPEFEALLKELAAKRLEAQSMKIRLDKANQIPVEGKTICALIVEKATSSARKQFYLGLRGAEPDRYRSGLREDEKPPERRIPEAELDRLIDAETAIQLRIDGEMSHLNGTVELPA